jgi:hypothetical protein
MADIKLSKNPTPDPARPEVGKPFKLTAEVTRDPSGPVWVWWSKDDVVVDGTRSGHQNPTGAIEVPLAITAFAETDYGTYKVCAAASDSTTSLDLGDQAAVKVEKSAPPADTGKDELRELVWDKDFAANTGMFVGLALLAFGALCAIGFVRSIDAAVAGTGFTSVVVFTGLFLGIVAVVVGGWLLVLEMRGRANIDPDAGKGVGVEVVAEGASKILGKLGEMRGPLALLSAGLLLFGGTAWLAYASDDDSPSQPPPAGSSVQPD